jgi:hypothetical protein
MDWMDFSFAAYEPSPFQSREGLASFVFAAPQGTQMLVPATEYLRLAPRRSLLVPLSPGLPRPAGVPGPCATGSVSLSSLPLGSLGPNSLV